MFHSLDNLCGMLLHCTLHLSQPHRLEQLQAVANHNCQVQSEFVPDDWIRDEMFAQLFPRQNDDFCLKGSCCSKRELMGRNQCGPTYRLTCSPLFDHYIFFTASHLHRKRQPDSSAFNQKQALRRISQPK